MQQDRADGVRADVPNPARIYDYVLGGKNNFPVDRQAAEYLTQTSPHIRGAMRENRHFLRRVVQYLAGEVGIGQFLDIGAGLPTAGNVHEVAQRARVVYVDNDPVVLTHARALLEDSDLVRVVSGDARKPRDILNNPIVRTFLDWQEPVAVLMIGLLHFIPDQDDPAGIVRVFRDAMPPGSHLAISHATVDGYDRSLWRPVRKVYDRASNSTTLRTYTQIAEYFDGFDLLPAAEGQPQGVVFIPRWRPEGPREDITAENTGIYGGVGVLKRR
ncbi:SAM-dependent methyltransferase [Sphaerisporangium flaviroseum]|uniref:SAM-dependent methyltransferase n=1 Tax=Sphaerisporangium flaviroseum TaxID=509199 RepID=A0ABP7ILV5_9ACTN